MTRRASLLADPEHLRELDLTILGA